MLHRSIHSFKMKPMEGGTVKPGRGTSAWETEHSGKYIRVSANIVRFAYWSICVLETVYVEGFF